MRGVEFSWHKYVKQFEFYLVGHKEDNDIFKIEIIFTYKIES